MSPRDGLLLPQSFSTGSNGRGKGRSYTQGFIHALALLLSVSLILYLLGWQPFSLSSNRFSAKQRAAHIDPVLVSYSYFEKDPIQKANFEFFMAAGMGSFSQLPAPRNTDFVIVISGDVCTPCKALMPLLSQMPESSLTEPLSAAWAGQGLTILQRKENEGMDIAAHNVTVEWLASHGSSSKYKHWLFLNSSIRGPFVPSYMPAGWQWTQAFTAGLSDDVKIVSSSLVCLPEIDAGGRGPKVESWAFATDTEGLRLLSEGGVFGLRTCKLCKDGIVVRGEYGLSTVLMSHGYNVATLMSRYAKGTDWRDRAHWNCNNNVHPSRAGTYDDITMHPFETVFVKASWHVGQPFTDHYTKWIMGHALGQANTAGTFDEKLYRFGVSPQAQEPRNYEACYRAPI